MLDILVGDILVQCFTVLCDGEENSINIAILIPELEGGGAERIASLVGNYYVGKGHTVYYFLAKDKNKCVYKVYGKVINTEIVLSDKQDLSLLKSALIMRKYKRKYKIDVSISFMEEFNYINILSKSRDIVITRICTILSKREDLQKSYLYKKELIRFMYNHSDKVVVMTDYAMNEMIKKYGVNRKKLVKIPNSITKLEQAKECNRWLYGDNTVICIGRLEDVKQHNVAIRAFSTVVQNIPSAKLIILGIGQTEGKLKALIKKLHLENNVFLLGFKENINYYLQNSKVFLMTSKTEGFPNSMLEAMSLGIPVVSIDSPGAPREIVRVLGNKDSIQCGEYGIITPYINHNYLSQQPIMPEEKLLGNAVSMLLQDKELWKRYSDASCRRAKMYDTEKIMSRWTKLIECKRRETYHEERNY